jgi:hypothetical protein
MNNREEVATQAAHRRQDDGVSQSGGDRSVDGVAARRENAYPGGRREGMVGCNEASTRHDRGFAATGEMLAGLYVRDGRREPKRHSHPPAGIVATVTFAS